MGNNIQSYRYKELDALRGIAALIVVFFHFTMGRSEAKLGFKLGVTGVDLFFLISGFVIFMSLTRVNNSLDFVINRVSRLYPTYWTCVTFNFILISVYSINKNEGLAHIDFIKYLGNMTMFQCYFKISDLDGSYWTMITEMTFYIGILILFHLKLLKYLNIIGIGLSVFVVIITSLGGDMILVNKIICWIPSLQFIPLFFAGTIFYKIYTIKSKLVENYAILIICLISQIFLFNYSGRSRFFLVRSEYAIMLIIYFVLFTLFVNGKLNFIVSKWTLFLGKISFALYLIHDLISINFIIPFLTNKLHVNFWIASFVISLPIVILLASIITYYIEIPISKSMKEKLSTTLAHKI
jgi:peptidoglycan/LPS O-acetylase OafA/YrhL